MKTPGFTAQFSIYASKNCYQTEKWLDSAQAHPGIFPQLFRQSTLPISKCEQNCIRDFPDDIEKRWNCIFKCIAEGKPLTQRVFAVF